MNTTRWNLEVAWKINSILGYWEWEEVSTPYRTRRRITYLLRAR